MEIIFLGTSSGVPTKQRNVSGIAIKSFVSKSWCLVDCGEGTQLQLLHTKLSVNKLEAICITHVHGDHCYGMPGLLASAAMAGRSERLTIIAPRALQRWLESVTVETQLRLGYALEFISVEEFSGSMLLRDFDVSIHRLSHRVPSYAYDFLENKIEYQLDQDKLRSAGVAAGPVWGQLQKGIDVVLEDGREIHAADFVLPLRKARRIIIAGDNDKPELLSEACQTADVLVHESTYLAETAEKIGFEPGHSSAASVARFAERSKLPNLVLTHFSPRYCVAGDNNLSISDVEREARLYYQGSLFLANDFDHFKLERNGQLRLMSSGVG